MQIPCRPGVHFEWLFKGRGQNRSIDVALHAETTSRERNKQLCLYLKDKATEALLSALGEPAVFAAEANARGWSSIYIRRPFEEWNEELAQWAAETMHKFRHVLVPFVDDFYALPPAMGSAAGA